MSSYNHLYLVDSDSEVVSHEQDLRVMVERLGELGLGMASRETWDIIADLMHFTESIQTRVNRLRDVWKYVEWFDSGYCDAESVRQAYRTYLRCLEGKKTAYVDSMSDDSE